MVLESIVICVDDSDYMRNEDFVPDRLKAQVDAVQVVIYAKLRSSPENYLGLVTMANNRVLTNLTNQEAKLLGDLGKMEVKGSIRLLPSLNVSQLVLKHRPIKHAKCRIIAFVGSPVIENESDVVNLGKKFKKENVSVDIVTFGSEPGAEVLKSLIDTLNGPSGTNNSFHTVPPLLVLSDYVVSCGLVAAHRDYGMTRGEDVDEDEELRRAIEWSMLESGGQSTIPPPTAQPTGIQDGNDLSDDEQLRIAIQLSLQEAQRLEVIREEPQQPGNTRSNTPSAPEQDGPANSKPKSETPNSTANPTDHNTTSDNNTNPPNPTSNKENTNPSNTNTNNTNTNPNNNQNNAAAAPSNSDTGKTAADSKEAKKTIMTKKR